MTSEPAKRFLIVNADDFGASDGVNRGIIEAHERGIVTSTSMMVLGAAAEEAGAYVAHHERLGAGLHVDLGEWAYRAGEWIALYEVVDLTDAAALATEIERQLTEFRRLTGKLPTHLDSHQHAHCREPARSALLELGRRLSVPVRHYAPGVRYCGEFYGQTGEGEPLSAAVSTESFVAILARIATGYTELACHPGWASDLDTMYRDERAVELAVLCDPAIRAAIAERDISLCSFRNVPFAAGSAQRV